MLAALGKFVGKPACSEELRVQNYLDQTGSAQRLLEGQNAGSSIKGLLLLFELSLSYPHHTQDIINQLAAFLRTKFSCSPHGAPGKKELLECGIRLLAGIPRQDRNGHPFYFNLQHVHIHEMDLTRINFSSFSLQGTRFSQVHLTRAAFREADLSGVLFENCRLEYANFHKSSMDSCHMDDGTPTRFIGSRLSGINLHEADITYCELQNFDRIDLSMVAEAIAQNKIRILGG